MGPTSCPHPGAQVNSDKSVTVYDDKNQNGALDPSEAIYTTPPPPPLPDETVPGQHVTQALEDFVLGHFGLRHECSSSAPSPCS